MSILDDNFDKVYGNISEDRMCDDEWGTSYYTNNNGEEHMYDDDYTGATRYNYEYLKHQTVKAILFQIKGVDVWIPKSQIDFNEDRKTVDINRWWIMASDFKEKLKSFNDDILREEI